MEWSGESPITTEHLLGEMEIYLQLEYQENKSKGDAVKSAGSKMSCAESISELRQPWRQYPAKSWTGVSNQVATEWLLQKNACDKRN